MSDEYRRIEVIPGTARRRRWSVEEKLRILGESCEPGESGLGMRSPREFIRAHSPTATCPV